MPNVKKIEAEVKGWATAHVILALGISFAVGVFVGALL
jgi:hypothetical protein